MKATTRNHKSVLLAMGILLACTGVIGFAATRAQDASMSVTTLAWMTGAWQTSGGRAQSEEHWIRPAAGTLFGVSRTIAGDRTVFFEFLRIETRPNGIFYVAQPRGEKATDFKCVKLTGAEVVFENLQHDFPKRIIYRKNADGTLTARIEGDGTEKEKPQDFHFKPMK